MANLALHSAEKPDNLRATTGTVEVSTKRDNDAALALGARPIQQHEPAARHNCAQRGATANIDGAPVYALHMAQSPDQQAESLPRYDDSPSFFVPEPSEGAARFPKQLFGAVEESTGMTPSSPDSSSSVDDTRFLRISDPEHKCEREHLSTQSNDRASRKATADTRTAEERQTSITVSPIVSQRASP